jgi:serine/threonine-protein kinase
MKKIGRYIVQGLLGRGGMGKVFKVKLPIIDKIAALKILEPDPLTAKLLGPDKLHSLFRHEAVTMTGIRHPNIVSVYDYDEHQGKPFFVMDYYPNNLGAIMGEDYSVEHPSRRISVDRSIDYALQTIDGLDCLHDAGILHRDIKPFNLLITAQNRVKICDFGLSKLRNESFSGPKNLNVGSPYYAAPEQEADPENVDARSDLYSLGIMFYRMLTCRLPYLNDMDWQYPPPSELNRDLDSQWDAFFAKAINRNRQRRFAHAREMKKALTELQAHWKKRRELSCSLPDLNSGEPPLSPRPIKIPLRHSPYKIRPQHALGRFNLDHLWQPNGYVRNHFIKISDKTVEDRSTGLMWQISGSHFPRTWTEAHLYIHRLNQEAYGEIDHWRIPTIDELVTILKPSAQGSALCIAPVFDTTQRWIWSTDRRSYVSAYYADMELGFVGWQDFSAPYYVRAVSSPIP